MENTLELEDTRVLVLIPMDKNDLWSEVFGSGWESYPWWTRCDHLEGDWQTHGQVRMSYCNPEDVSVPIQKSAIITIDTIANAYSFLMTEGFTHCRGGLINEYDACTSDAILQVAVFGEVLYS